MYAIAAVAFFTKNMPPHPEAGKWTTLSPIVDWMGTFQMVSDGAYLSELVDLSFKHITVDIAATADLPSSSLSFHQVSGVRLNATRELVNSDPATDGLRILMSVLPATRYSTTFFLQASKEFQYVCNDSMALDLAQGFETVPALVEQARPSRGM